MGTLILALLIGLMIACLAFSSETKETPRITPSATTYSQSESSTPSREELNQRLERFADLKPTTIISQNQGALCYIGAERAQRIDYVCPSCGNRTAYSDVTQGENNQTWGRVNDISASRLMVAKIRKAGLDAALDESEFCRKCAPDIKDPKLILTVKKAGILHPFRLRGIDLDGLEAIEKLLNGQFVVQNPMNMYFKLFCKEIGLLKKTDTSIEPDTSRK